MFDKEAIEKIQESIACKGVQDTLINAETLTPTIAVPSGISVDSLERFMPNRSRFRGRMDTDSVDDFIEYVNSNSVVGQTQCFINKDKMFANAIFNLGGMTVLDDDGGLTKTKAGHADHRAVLHLKRTADYDALLSYTGDSKSQTEIAQFLEDWRDSMKAFVNDADGELRPITIREAILGVRNLTVAKAIKTESNVGNHRNNRSMLENIDLSSSEGVTPEFFAFTCVPYEGLPPVDFMLRMSATYSKDNAEIQSVTLSIIRFESIREQISQDFKAKLLERINKVPTYIGEFAV